MGSISRKDVSLAMAQLMPQIIQGVHLDFLTSRQITQTQFLVLVAIHSRERAPMSILAQNMKVSMPTISGIVDRLVRAGYLRRVEDLKDRRQVMVELTAKGKGLILQFQAAVSERWQEVLAALSAQELESFYQVVVKLTQALRQGR